jgi:hypothetical protein
MGLFSFIGGLFGAGAQKKASNEAEAAQLGYLNKGLDLQKQQYDQSRADSLPWLEAGTAALSGQQDLLGLHGGDTQAGAIEALRQSPGYQSLYRNGEEALLQNASATGGIRGGNTHRGLADFGADTLSQIIQQRLGNLGGLSSQGGATGQYLGGLGANYANQGSGLYGNMGQVRAGGLLTRGGITSGMWKSAGSFADEIASAIAGGGGGGGGFAQSMFGG